MIYFRYEDVDVSGGAALKQLSDDLYEDINTAVPLSKDPTEKKKDPTKTKLISIAATSATATTKKAVRKKDSFKGFGEVEKIPMAASDFAGFGDDEGTTQPPRPERALANQKNVKGSASSFVDRHAMAKSSINRSYGSAGAGERRNTASSMWRMGARCKAPYPYDNDGKMYDATIKVVNRFASPPSVSGSTKTPH